MEDIKEEYYSITTEDFSNKLVKYPIIKEWLMYQITWNEFSVDFNNNKNSEIPSAIIAYDAAHGSRLHRLESFLELDIPEPDNDLDLLGQQSFQPILDALDQLSEDGMEQLYMMITLDGL